MILTEDLELKIPVSSSLMYTISSFRSEETKVIFFSILIVFLVALLNKTIKPLLVRRTIPITGLTFGLFYPCINLFILKLVDWILGNHFQLNNIFMALFFAILLSIVNFIIEEIIKKIIKRVKKYE